MAYVVLDITIPSPIPMRSHYSEPHCPHFYSELEGDISSLHRPF